jgi:uncharacterized membrane protein YfcA
LARDAFQSQAVLRWSINVMAGFAFHTIALVWLGALVGGIAAGGAGFAFALAASSIWLHALDPLHTTAFVVASGTLIHVGFVWSMRRSLEPTRLAPFIVGAFVGIPIGVHILSHSNTRILKLVLGLFLIAYGVYALTKPQLPFLKAGRMADAVVGFIGGLLGGIGGYSGVLPTIWTQLRGWDKETSRSVYQPYILFCQILTLCLVGTVAFDNAAVLLFATTIPALFFGALIGWRIYSKLNEHRFRQLLALVLVASGVTLVF